MRAIFNCLFIIVPVVFTNITAANSSFTENKGQIRDQHYQPRPDVLYSGSANVLYYHLKKDSLHYQLFRSESWRKDGYQKRFLSEAANQIPDRVSV